MDASIFSTSSAVLLLNTGFLEQLDFENNYSQSFKARLLRHLTARASAYAFAAGTCLRMYQGNFTLKLPKGLSRCFLPRPVPLLPGVLALGGVGIFARLFT